MTSDYLNGSRTNGKASSRRNAAGEDVTEARYQSLLDRIAALRETVTDRLAGDVGRNIAVGRCVVGAPADVVNVA